jgi:hypothetical protein
MAEQEAGLSPGNLQEKPAVELNLLCAALRAELGAFGLRSAARADSSLNPFNLRPTFRAEFSAHREGTAFRAGVAGGLGHQAAAFGAEFCARRGERPVLWTACSR